MITMTTTVFKKTTLALIGLACAAGVIFSVGMQKNDTEVQAAVTETSRLWMQVVNKDQWDSSGAHTHIHYWGGASSTTWPGVNINYDSNNDKCYFDVPPDTTQVIFVRMAADGDIAWTDGRQGVWNQTADLVATGHFNTWYFSLTGYGGGSWVSSFTANTTVVVSNFAATIDTSGEACSASAAQNAVDTYNALSTFEQDQFDVLNVGGGVTGLQRLNFLKTRYSIATELNANDVGGINQERNTSLLTMLIIGLIGLSTLGGYAVISHKKNIA